MLCPRKSVPPDIYLSGVARRNASGFLACLWDHVFHRCESAQSAAASLISAAAERPGVTDTRAISVRAVRLDDFIQSIRPVNGLLVKIDTEGADFKVLRGMGETIVTKHCVIQIEFSPALVDTYADPVYELMNLSLQHDLIDVGSATNTALHTSGIPAFVDRIRAQPGPSTTSC
jgi:hypothetical protein